MSMSLADREATDGVAVEADVVGERGASLPEVGPEPALHDPEEALILAPMGGLAARLPARGPLDALGAPGLVDAVGEALVEDHGDVGAERLLDLHGALGRQEGLAPVHLVGEGHALLVHLRFLEGEYLEPARVREDRDGDAHHPVEAAVLLDDALPWPLAQVVGIRQHDLTAGLEDVIGGERADRPLGADRQENGGHDVPARELQRRGASSAVLRVHAEGESMHAPD
jgi:hypothetical protein